MRRQHCAAEIAFKSDEGIQPVGIDDHLRAALGAHSAHKRARVGKCRETGTNCDNGFVLHQI